MVELSEIKRLLLSATLKHRREAVKLLDVQLASPLFLRQLDINTVKLWPEDKIQLVSWPGLVDTYLSYIHKEVTEHKKQLDATALKVFKTIFTAADNAERCGPGRNNLLRRAGAAFDKFGKVLEVSPLGQGLATPLGKDIASVLLKVLLPNQAYCQRATVEAFQGLVEEVMLRFEALQQQVEESSAASAHKAAAATAAGRLAAGGRGSGSTGTAAIQQEFFSMANLLAGLLTGVPGQMAGMFVVDLLAFLTQALSWLDKQGEYGRVSRQLMACLNGLLLTYGADLRPQLPTTHKALSTYIRHAWTAHTNVPIKDGVLCYCRLSVALGGAQAVGTSLNDLLDLVSREINAPSFTWDLAGSKQHQQLAPLAATLYYYAAFASAATAAGRSAAAASGAAATAAAAEVGSCGSNGDAPTAAGAGKGKRRSSTTDISGATPAATAGGNGEVAGGDVDSEDELLQLPRKRSRVMGPAGQLLMFLQTDPERWGPVTALLLHQHGPLLPPAFLAALQQQLAASVGRCQAALCQALTPASGSSAPMSAAAVGAALDRRSTSPAGISTGAAAAARAAQCHPQLLWLTRCLCELALCWPSALHPLAAGVHTSAAAMAGSQSDPAAAAAAAAAAADGSLGPAYGSSEGCCRRQAWLHADALAAQGRCSSGWHQLWDGCTNILAGEPAEAGSVRPDLFEAVTWLLHVLVALRLVQLPSRAATLTKLQRLWLPKQQQQGQAAAGDAHDDELQHSQQQEQQIVLSSGQLALLLSLCLGQQVTSHRDMLLRQQLLQACFSTAEAATSSSRRSSRFSSGHRGVGLGSAAAAAGAHAGARCLPDLLLPVILALLGAPGLPTPSLNGAPAAVTAASSAQAVLGAVQHSWCFATGPGATAAGAAGIRDAHGLSPTAADSLLGGCSSSTINIVWYSAGDTWWWAEQHLEVQLAGLETGLDSLKRQLAAERLQQVLAAAAGSDAGPGATTSETPAAEAGAPCAWWKCWCRLADETAEYLSNALLPFTPGSQDDDHGWGPSQETVAAGGGPDGAGPAAAAAAPADPVMQLCHLLLLLNASVSLPCIAALQHQRHQQQQQQAALERQRKVEAGCLQQDQEQPGDQAQAQQQEEQRLREGMFCGFGFSRHPEQHQQLQQLVMEAGIRAGELLADNLQHLPCHPSSTWLQQLMHLGNNLARIQALMTALPTTNGPDSSKVKYQMLAAASLLAEVVKMLERVTKQSADAASAELEGQQGGAGAGDELDLVDDFMDTGLPPARPGQYGSTQQQGFAMPAASMMSTPAPSYRPSQMGPYTAARPGPGAAAASAGAAHSSGPAVIVGGGLAGFSGRAALGLGNPSASMSPAMLPAHGMFTRVAAAGEGRGEPGFAVGALGEGLSGLCGVEGAGLRVFAALAPAYADTAQALMRLWVHMAGLTGWAPPESLLQAVVEVATTAVCTGGWSHLQQLFGLMKGSHTLLAAQKVPSSTSHLILRLLQQVAVAAAAAGLRLDVPCAVPESQGSQEQSQLSSQDNRGAKQGSTYVSFMLEICADVQKRLGLKQGTPQGESHLAMSTQLQLGLTTLALLQLQPQAGYSTHPNRGAAAGTTASHAAMLAAWRQQCLLVLMSSPSFALRARAGPLAAALLTAVAAGSAAAGPHAGHATGSSSSGASITECVSAALADISGYLFLQDSTQLTAAQAARAHRRQEALQQLNAPGAVGVSAKAELDAASREAHQDALAWEVAVVQLADLARATLAATCAALQQQQQANALDAQLLMLLLRHTASLQLLPEDSLSSQGSGKTGSGSSCSSSSSIRLRALRTAAAALDVMSARQQYPDRFAYLHYHCTAWAKEWVSADCTVQSLLAVQALMCAPAAYGQPGVLLFGSSPALEAAAATPEGRAPGTPAPAPDRSLLQCFGSSLVFWMIFYDKQAELSALAAAAGLEEEALLQGFKHELCSSLYPLLQVPELRPQVARFRQKVPKNAEALTQEANVTLVFSMLEHALPVLPPVSLEEHEQAQDGRPQLDLEATLPFLTQAAASVGFAVVAKVQKEVSWLAALPFNPAGIQALLLRVHRSVASAECPMHKVQRMGQFQCLLRQLPTAHLQSPAVARSLVSMLLQQLHVTQLQGICCSCLQMLFSELFLAVPSLLGGQAGDSLSEAKKAGSTAKQQQQQQQQQRQHQELVTALLEELLPPTVAALVQCVEGAVAGVQLQQQAELWALHPNAAAAAAGSSSAGLDLISGLAPVVLLHSLLQSDFLSKSRILMDPLPPLPALSVTQQQRRWYAGDLLCLVPWFADRAASMTASSRQRAVHELLAKLQGGGGAGVLFAKQHDNSRTPQQISTEGERTEAAVHPKVAAAAFKLARIGAELCDEHVMQLAAELLAVVGPMDPDVITLDLAAAAAGEGPGSTGRSSSSSSSSHADKTAFPLRAVLRLLAEGLFDSRPHVVSSAQQTLAALVSVLDTSVLQEALQPPGNDASVPGHSAGLLLQSYVATYILSRSGYVILECSTDASAAASIAAASKDLWSPVGKSYQQWLCSLSSTLLQACGAVADAAVATRRSGRTATATAATGSSALASAALLQLLADAAAINPQLAELLLPHAVLKLCESDSSGADVPGAGSLGWAARLAAAAAAGLRLEELVDSAAGAMGSPDVSPWEGPRTGDTASGTADAVVGAADGVDARCYSVLLACLEHNRSLHRLAIMAMPCDPVPASVAWHRSFCLHLDYLAVAAAAMAVKAYFTALLYIEQWCADARQTDQNPFDGSVADSSLLQLQQLAGLNSSNSTGATSASAGFAQQGARQQQLLLEQLLLELYSNVNEPDGVYAVAAAFGSPTSQLQVLQHEQQWAAVLGGQDALLQAAVLQGSQHWQGNTLHVAGALTALQRLGCPATAQRCVSGALLQQQQQVHTSIALPASFQAAQQHQQRQQQQAQRLVETQRELAWRLSDWGLADSLNPGGAGQPGFATGVGSGPLGMAAAGAASLVTPPVPQDGQQEQGFHAAVLAALTALERRDEDDFSVSVSGARQGCVLQLARSSTQSAAAVNPLLVQLQMLQMLSQGLAAAKSAAAAASAADTDWSAGDTRSLLTQLLGLQLPAGACASPAAIKLCGVSFELSDQLLSLQAALTRVLRRPDALLATLQASMRVARKGGQVNFAAAAVAQLQETLHQAVLGSRVSAHGQPGLIGLGLQPVSGGASSGAHKLPSWLERAIAADAGWPLEAAKLRWLQGQHQVALKELQSLATSLQTQLTGFQNKQQEQQKQATAGSANSSPLEQDVRSVTYALTEAKMLLGKWMAAGEGSFSSVQGAVQHLQNAAELTGKYLTQVGLSGDMMRLHSRVCYQLAACADQHYQMLDAQVASPEFQKQQQVLRTKEQLLQQLSGAVEASRNWQRLPPAKQQSAKAAYMPVARRFAETQRQVQLDRQAVAQLQQSRTNYLTAALAAYRECIKAGDKHDLQVVYRMCGLWFRHSDDTTINSILNETFKDVPTAKFIPLVYQIASRLDNTAGVFQVALTNALYWMATDHPYHALYPIIALSNGDTDGGDPAGKNIHIRHETNTGRVAAATALLQRLRDIPQLQPIVDDMTAQVQDLIGMTLQVHKALPRDQRGSLTVDQYTMPANFRRKLKSLQHAPPICYSLPLDPQRRYDAVPNVVEIDTTIKIAGGINSPLIVRTTDNYGRVQRQLCKCNDDLRQDAVMQQFFGLVDTLLGGSPDSRQRRLGIRTYRVVPCSPLVGVLEWVEGTLPLTEYLLGDRSSSYAGGASARYHRQEGLSWLECYMRMDKAQPTDLKATYLYCCKHFPPVFRHFFLEAFPYPSDWFEARTRYTRSTAVASMAGAIIGLGDRHLGNILLDTRTAEVVHIDLGIAFEQGLFLQTPERVPFRLTPNIVDGMGAAGVEGPFRRCCETALQVLRRHQDALLTVVQVVLHDPLYRWQMTPIKAGRKQQDPIPAEQGAGDAAAGMSTGAAAAAAAAGETSAGGPSSAAGPSSGSIGNADAERAVLRVKQKLQGQDVEGGASLSEAAQVAAMVQTARDPDNLSRMFKGWAPWV